MPRNVGRDMQVNSSTYVNHLSARLASGTAYETFRTCSTETWHDNIVAVFVLLFRRIYTLVWSYRWRAAEGQPRQASCAPFARWHRRNRLLGALNIMVAAMISYKYL